MLKRNNFVFWICCLLMACIPVTCKNRTRLIEESPQFPLGIGQVFSEGSKILVNVFGKLFSRKRLVGMESPWSFVSSDDPSPNE